MFADKDSEWCLCVKLCCSYFYMLHSWNKAKQRIVGAINENTSVTVRQYLLVPPPTTQQNLQPETGSTRSTSMCNTTQLYSQSQAICATELDKKPKTEF